ncbi:MAG: hypothetical protein ACOYMA_21830 [Bacteroidia bacterium]
MINIKVDYETADKITVQTLKDYRDSLQKFLDDGSTHPDDLEHNTKMIEAINFVIKDFASE